MTFLFDINHPSHVHVFKHVMEQLRHDGHTCLVTARRKEHTHRLLQEYGIPYVSTGVTPVSFFCKALKGLVSVIRLVWIMVFHKVDMAVSMESPYSVAAAWLCRKPSVTVADTETAHLIHKITGPLSSTVLVPQCFRKTISKRQVSFNGYKELAYLHPERFHADIEVLHKNGIPVDKPYALVRFVAFRAMHDRGLSGFSQANKLLLVTTLARHIKVYISSELPLCGELAQYSPDMNPADMHHMLAYAALFVGESTTMAAEAAVLGVPSVCLNDMELGYISELADQYGLIFKYDSAPGSQNAAINKAVELAGRKDARREWQQRRQRMLGDKTDVTGFITSFLNDYFSNFDY